MMGLLGDGWFYVSAAGFIISAVFFVFLLGQYRAAVESEDEETPAADADAVPPSVAPLAAAPAPTLAAATSGSSSSQPASGDALASGAPSKAASLPKPSESEAKPAPAKENTTGGLSPAVVYLQNMKLQMERMEKDVAGLKTISAQQNTHTDLILKRLTELSDQLASIADAQRALAEGAFVAPQAAAPPPVPQQVTIPAPEKKPEPAPAPEPSPIRTIEIPAPEAAAPAPEPAPAPVVEAPKPEKKPRKGVIVPEDAAPDKTLVIEPTVKPVKSGGDDIPLPPRPGFEAEKPAEPAKEPTIELSPPAGTGEAPAESPKPARKGPVWPI